MNIMDLTQLISEDMPVYPDTEPPRLSTANTIEVDHFRETILRMYSHTGTHTDPPAHIISGRETLDAMPIESFVGSAVVIDCRDIERDGRVPLERITAHGEAAESADFLLFNYGWDRYWGRPEYFEGYPCLSDEAVDFVLRTKKKGVGFDCISADPVGSLAIHRRLFERSMIIVENLTNLDKLPREVTLFALPLKYKDADGAPIRAVATF